MKHIILLNGGKRTREAFATGITNTTMASYRSKEMIAHLKDTRISFLHHNQEIDLADTYVFTRLRAEDSHFCGILYEHLEATGIPASDPINLSFRYSEEKISSMARLVRAGISIPETIIAQEESFRKNYEYILSQISFPLVYKTDGSQGRNVFKIETLEELEQKIKEKKRYELFLLQELIPNTFDTRTLVAYGEILGSIERRATTHSFLNNVAQGGTVAPYTLTDTEKEVALTATKACRLDFGGVDIIHTEKGPVVLEVNKSPQIGGFESVYGKGTVFKRIAELIETQNS